MREILRRYQFAYSFQNKQMGIVYVAGFNGTEVENGDVNIEFKGPTIFGSR